MMRPNIRTSFIMVGLSLSFLALFVFPEQISSAISESVQLCLQAILPSLFPYFVLTDWFLSFGCAAVLSEKIQPFMKKMFHTSGFGATPFLVGLLGGYPLGAKAIAQLYQHQQITQREADKLLTFCCNAGPAFTIGVVGVVLYHSPAIGAALYGIQFLSACLTGLLPYPRSHSNCSGNMQRNDKTSPVSRNIVDGITNAIGTTARVCSFILFFSVVISLERLILGQDNVLYPIMSLLTELSTGCFALAGISFPWTLKFSLTAAGISLGGICILFQTMAVIADTGLSIKPYCIGKLIQSLISFLLSLPISLLFNETEAAGSFPITMAWFSPNFWSLFPLALLFLLFLQFPSSNFLKGGL